MKLLTILVLALAHDVVCSQYTNCTIDDTDPIVYYNGSWNEIGPTSLDYDGTHALSSDSSATAIFCFKGVAIYYMSPLWPYPVNSMLTLDGKGAECVNLQDLSRPETDGGPETVQSAPVWGIEGLEDVEHELVVSMCPGGQYVVVDAFIFTELEGISTTLLPTSTFSANSISSSLTTRSDVVVKASATASPTAASHSSKHLIPMAVGSACVSLALLAVVLACIFCLRRRKQHRRHSTSKESCGGRDVYDDDSYTPVPSRTSTSRFTTTSGMLYPHVAINDHFYPTNANGLYDHWFSSPADFENIFSYYRDSVTSMFKSQPTANSNVPNLRP